MYAVKAVAAKSKEECHREARASFSDHNLPKVVWQNVCSQSRLATTGYVHKVVWQHVCAVKRSGGSRDTYGTHGTHGRTRAHGSHIDEPHNHPNPPTHPRTTARRPNPPPSQQQLNTSTAAAPEPTAPRAADSDESNPASIAVRTRQKCAVPNWSCLA